MIVDNAARHRPVSCVNAQTALARAHGRAHAGSDSDCTRWSARVRPLGGCNRLGAVPRELGMMIIISGPGIRY